VANRHIALDEYRLYGIVSMPKKWEVEFTDQFQEWWDSLPEDVQESIAHDVDVLEQIGPGLGRPAADAVKGSRYPNMKELRTQHDGEPYRTFFAFDPRRCAILLIGGNKGGDSRFYERFIPIADRLYQEHLDALRREGRI
jgi:hypothetical protein